MRDEAVWIYVNITDNKKKPFSVANGVYVVHYFNTDYICIANLKASFRQYVCQVNIWGFPCCVDLRNILTIEVGIISVKPCVRASGHLLCCISCISVAYLWSFYLQCILLRSYVNLNGAVYSWVSSTANE